MASITERPGWFAISESSRPLQDISFVRIAPVHMRISSCLIIDIRKRYQKYIYNIANKKKVLILG